MRKHLTALFFNYVSHCAWFLRVLSPTLSPTRLCSKRLSFVIMYRLPFIQLRSILLLPRITRSRMTRNQFYILLSTTSSILITLTTQRKNESCPRRTWFLLFPPRCYGSFSSSLGLHSLVYLKLSNAGTILL